MEKTSAEDRQHRMFQLIDEFQRSGKTRKVFCLEQNIALSKFYYWQRKSQEISENEGPGLFVPVKTGGRTRHVQSPGQYVILQYPNGVSLQVPVNIPVATIGTLIHLI